MREYKYYSDPSHGWLEVPFIDIFNLGLQNQISVYSYRNKDMVYLEHDSDLPKVTTAIKNSGEEIKLNIKPASNDDSFIRSYAPYY